MEKKETGKQDCPKQQQYLKLRDVARILGVTPKRVRLWCRNGALAYHRTPTTKNRSPYLIAKSDLDDFMAQYRVPAKPSRLKKGGGTLLKRPKPSKTGSGE